MFLVCHSAGALALEDLCIEAGAYAWKLRIAIISLSYDGNLTDASLLAAMAALMCLKLPQTQRVEDELFVTEGRFFFLEPVSVLLAQLLYRS